MVRSGTLRAPVSSRQGPAPARFRRARGLAPHARQPSRRQDDPRVLLALDADVPVKLGATPDFLECGEREVAADAAAGRDRALEAQALEADVDAGVSPGDRQAALEERRQQREGQKAMRDRAALAVGIAKGRLACGA